MAQFKEVTQLDDSKIVINMDQIATMERLKGETIIKFGEDESVVVKETPGEIVAKSTFQGDPQPTRVMGFRT